MGNCLGTEAEPSVDGSPDDFQAYVTARQARTEALDEAPIHDAVSERLPTAAAQGSRSVVDLIGGPGYLDTATWTANLDVPVVKARATALEKGVDAVLDPLLDSVEKAIPQSQHLTWATLELEDLYTLLKAAAQTHVALKKCSNAVESLLGLMLAIQKTAQANKLLVPEDIFQVASINRLLRFVGIITAQYVGVEPREICQARWNQWQRLTAALGLAEDALALTLDAPSRALLLLLQSCAAHGNKTATFTLFRDHAFEAAWRAMEATEHYSQGGPCILAPVFRDFAHQAPQEGSFLETDTTGHGPCRELYRLVGQEMIQGIRVEEEASSSTQLFVQAPGATWLWFNIALSEEAGLRAAYAFAGWLVGQMCANRASLCVPLPDLIFDKLLAGTSFQASLERLQEFAPATAATLRNICAPGQMQDSEFEALLASEGCPASTTRREYAGRQVWHHLVGAVRWQFAAFAEGFNRALDPALLARWRVTGHDLAELCRGGPLNPRAQFGIRRSFCCCVAPNVPRQLAEALYEVVDNWSLDKKLQFVAFVTGGQRPCPVGPEVLNIVLAFVPQQYRDQASMLQRLPMAHTCDNTLALPNYWDGVQQPLRSSGLRLSSPRHSRSQSFAMDKHVRQVLDERLSYAVEHCTTYNNLPNAGRFSRTHSKDDEVVVDMASQMESIDDDLQPGTPKLPQMLQERLDLSPSKDKKRGGGRSRLAQASFPSGNLANGQPGKLTGAESLESRAQHRQAQGKSSEATLLGLKASKDSQPSRLSAIQAVH